VSLSLEEEFSMSLFIITSLIPQIRIF
jgi:hypothetical protein